MDRDSVRREYKREKDLKRIYGHGLDYGKMFAAQNGVCKLCRKPPKVGGNSLNVDHCHKTGRIRGLLCGPCNGAIGQLGDDVAGLRRAVSYLIRPVKMAPLKKKVTELPTPSGQPVGWRARVRSAQQVVWVETRVRSGKIGKQQ